MGSPKVALLTQLGANVVEMEHQSSRGLLWGWRRTDVDGGTPRRTRRGTDQRAQATGAATVAIGCPFCMTMIGDGTRELGVDDQLSRGLSGDGGRPPVVILGLFWGL